MKPRGSKGRQKFDILLVLPNPLYQIFAKVVLRIEILSSEILAAFRELVAEMVAEPILR